jgi:hypothetical protein
MSQGVFLSEWDGLTQDNDISVVKKQASTGKVHENRAAADGTTGSAGWPRCLVFSTIFHGIFVLLLRAQSSGARSRGGTRRDQPAARPGPRLSAPHARAGAHGHAGRRRARGHFAGPAAQREGGPRAGPGRPGRSGGRSLGFGHSGGAARGQAAPREGAPRLAEGDAGHSGGQRGGRQEE